MPDNSQILATAADRGRQRARTTITPLSGLDMRSPVNRLLAPPPIPMRPVNPLANVTPDRVRRMQEEEEALRMAEAEEQAAQDAAMSRAIRTGRTSLTLQGLGAPAQMAQDLFLAPSGREALAQTAGDAGEWIEDVGEDALEYLTGGGAQRDLSGIPDALEGLPRVLEGAPSAIARAGNDIGGRVSDAAPNAWRAGQNVLNAGARIIGDDPLLPMRALQAINANVGRLAVEQGPGIVTEALVGPQRRFNDAAFEAEVMERLGNSEEASARIRQALPDAGWSVLNMAGLGLLDAPDLVRAGRGVMRGSNAARTARTAEGVQNAASQMRVYQPDDFTRVTVEPDGRIVATYQGAYTSGGGSAEETAAALRDGSGQEALRLWRGVEDALRRDISDTQRPSYHWTPGDENNPDPRLAQFYRNAMRTRTPEGYVFTETPDGVMHLTRQADTASRPVGSGEAIDTSRAGNRPPSPIDWEAPIAPERSAMRDLGIGAGTGVARGPNDIRDVARPPSSVSPPGNRPPLPGSEGVGARVTETRGENRGRIDPLLAIGVGAGTGAALYATDASSDQFDQAETDVQRQQERLRAFEDLSARAANDPAATRELQTIISAIPDGRYGPETAQRASEYAQQIRRDLEAATERRRRLEEAAMVERLSVTPEEAAQREAMLAFGALAGAAVGKYGLPIPRGTPLIGGLSGLGGRSGTSRIVREDLADRVARAEAIEFPERRLNRRSLTEDQVAAERAASVNDFWRQGLDPGSAQSRVPFRIGSGQRPEIAPDAVAASRLFQPPRFSGQDYGYMAVGGLDAGIAIALLPDAERKLEEAERDFEETRSYADLQRVENAREYVTRLEIMARVGVGFVGGRVIGGYTDSYGGLPRPSNLRRAEAEQGRIARYVAPPEPRRPPEPPPRR